MNTLTPLSTSTGNNRVYRNIFKPRFMVLAIILAFSFLYSVKSYAGNNPVIILKGDTGLLDTMKVEQGYPFTEPGDSAHSDLYGDITKNITVTSTLVGGSASFNNLVIGTYVFSYNVTDPVGNKAPTRYRVVRVTPDKTPPDLVIAKNKVSGTDTIYYEVSTVAVPPNLNPSLKSYLISSTDLVDGNLTPSVVIDSSLVQLNVVYIYPVTYTSTDLDSNKTVKTLYVDVIDTIKPVLTLRGANPDTIEVYSAFVDPGVVLGVSNGYLSKGQLRRWLRVSSTINDSALGTYIITYNLTDTFGNVAKTVTRIVVVRDNLPPVIKLKGPIHDSILVNNTYTDPGFTVSDNYTNTSGIKVTVSGTFITTFKNNYANKLGGGTDSGKVVDPLYNYPVGPDYRITYTAVDGSGNKSSITRYIRVYDNIPPVISLVGSSAVQVCLNSSYADLGYNVSDNYTDSAHIEIIKAGAFLTQGTSKPGIFYLQYIATDQAGNMSSVIRTIQVLPSSDANCQRGSASQNIIDTTVCKGSCLVITPWTVGRSYLWSNGDTTFTTKLCPKSDTAISVTITDPNMNGSSLSVSYLYNITFTKTSCVWPGDANGDGVADKNDVLAIGVAYGDSGAKRDFHVVSLNWVGQPCNDWANSFKSGANHKNADCNGDGTVDSTDMAAVSKNYGYTHSKTNGGNGASTDPPLSIAFSKDSVMAGDTVTATISLGSSSIPVKNAYGLAFSIPYNFFYVKPGKATVNLSNCWLGTPGKDLIYFLHDDSANNVIDFAVTRIDHKNVSSGYGELGTVSIVMQDNLGGKTWVNRKVVLTPSDVNLISADETPIPLYVTGDSNIVTGPLSGIYNQNLAGRFKLYPNPASQNIFIDAGGQEISGIQMIDELGKQVYLQNAPQKGIIEVPLSGLNSGIYTIIISTKNGTVARQVVKN